MALAEFGEPLCNIYYLKTLQVDITVAKLIIKLILIIRQ